MDRISALSNSQGVYMPLKKTKPPPKKKNYDYTKKFRNQSVVGIKSATRSWYAVKQINQARPNHYINW